MSPAKPHSRMEDEDGFADPVNFDPKRSRFTIPFLSLVAIGLGGFYGGTYVKGLLARLEANETTDTVQAKQLASLESHQAEIAAKFDQFIYIQNERAKWQSSSLRAIARKVGAETYQLPNPDESPPK
jgi:hypothetical protein